MDKVNDLKNNIISFSADIILQPYKTTILCIDYALIRMTWKFSRDYKSYAFIQR